MQNHIINIPRLFLACQMQNKRHVIVLTLSAILILLGSIFCLQRWTTYRRNSKTSQMPLQVWEGEGGQIPSVPTPLPASTEDEKKNRK